MMMGLTRTDWAPGLRSTIASWALAGSALLALCNLPGVSSGAEQPFTTGSSDVIIQEINSQIRESWKDNEVEPSPVADDSEWIRRVYLDIVGHIPSLEDVEKFLADKDKAKRTKLIEKLLDDPGYTRNWTTIWTNLCIGQQSGWDAEVFPRSIWKESSLERRCF